MRAALFGGRFNRRHGGGFNGLSSRAAGAARAAGQRLSNAHTGKSNEGDGRDLGAFGRCVPANRDSLTKETEEGGGALHPESLGPAEPRRQL